MSNSVFLKPDENGNWGKVGTDAAGSMSEQLVFQSGATATGDGTVADVSGYTSLRVYVTIGSVSNTVTGQGSDDGVTYYTQVPITSSTSGISANGTYIYNVTGFKFFRLRVSTYVSGSVTVTGYASVGDYSSPVTTGSFGALDTNSVNGVLLGVGAYNLLFDGTNWTRHRTASSDGSGSAGVAQSGLMGYNGTNWDRVRTINTGQLRTTVYNSSGTELLYVAPASVTDGSALSSGAGTLVSNVNFGFNGTNFDRVRVGKVYKHIEYLTLPDATGTTIWTPASGKKFRLMGISVSCGSAGRLALRDGSTGTDFIVRFLYAGADTKNFDFGNGYLSLQADRVLELRNNSGATVNAWVTAWGTEE